MPQARFDPALPPVALPQAAWEARVLQPTLPTVALVSGFEIDQKRQKQTQSIRPVDCPFIIHAIPPPPPPPLQTKWRCTRCWRSLPCSRNSSSDGCELRWPGNCKTNPEWMDILWTEGEGKTEREWKGKWRTLATCPIKTKPWISVATLHCVWSLLFLGSRLSSSRSLLLSCN